MRGRIVPKKWMIGMRDTKTELDPGSMIWTDQWSGHNSLERLGMFYRHEIVDHSENFIIW